MYILLEGDRLIPEVLEKETNSDETAAINTDMLNLGFLGNQ